MGKKLSSRHMMSIQNGYGNTRRTTTDLYIDGLILRGGKPLMWQFDGGYVDLDDNGSPTSWNYYVTDHLGSTRKVVDCNDSIRETISYYPFGSEMRMQDPSQMTGDFQHPYRFTGKELDRLNGLNMYDFGARWYDVAGVPMWTSVDPLAEKYYPFTPYSYCAGDPVNKFDPDGRDGIFIVFPDYKISTPLGKLSGLGHAGVLLIDNKSGLTKYYEYGRYDTEGKGLVRKQTVPNVIIGEDGRPTQASLDKALSVISAKAGQNGRIEGAYVKSDNFDIMNNYAKQRMEDNNNENRKPYSLTRNNCGTFAKDVLEADSEVKKQTPVIIDPRPVSMVEEFQETFESVSYNKK